MQELTGAWVQREWAESKCQNIRQRHSEHVFQPKLNLTRVHARTCDDAVVRRAKLRAGLPPDRQVRQVEYFDTELEMIVGYLEVLVERHVKTLDARSDNSVTL